MSLETKKNVLFLTIHRKAFSGQERRNGTSAPGRAGHAVGNTGEPLRCCMVQGEFFLNSAERACCRGPAC